VVDDQNRLCVPGGSFSSRIETIYNYYLPNDSYKSIDDVVFSDQSTTELDNYKVKYREGADSFTKVRSITAKESNRFNLIQTLNETF
jgi:hypothetical protein